MAKLNTPTSNVHFPSSMIRPATTRGDDFSHVQLNVEHVKLLLNVARMRRRSQRQLLVQIEQEQLQGKGLLILRSARTLPRSMADTTIDIPRFCSGTIMEEDEDDDENSYDINSSSSSNSTTSCADDS